MKSLILVLFFVCAASFSFAQDYTVRGVWFPPDANGDYSESGIKNKKPYYKNPSGFYIWYYQKDWFINDGSDPWKNSFIWAAPLKIVKKKKVIKSFPPEGRYKTIGKTYLTKEGVEVTRFIAPPIIPVSGWALAFGILLIGSFIFFRFGIRK